MTGDQAAYETNTGPSVDFEYPDDAPVDPIRVFSALVSWAGRSRARQAVISKLLGQDTRSNGSLARQAVVSRQAISRAVSEGKAEITRLLAGGTF